MAPLKLSGFRRSFWVPVVPCLFFSGLSPSEPLSQSGMKVLAENTLSPSGLEGLAGRTLFKASCMYLPTVSLTC